MNTFYYTIEKQLSSIFTGQPLVVTGHIKVYEDAAKQNWLTDMPFPEMGLSITFDECPKDTKENYDNYIENKALEAISQPNIQDKLNQVKMAYDLGLIYFKREDFSSLFL